MDNNELNRIADLIVSDLEGRNGLTKPQKIRLIKPVLIKLSSDSRQIGRTQILNYWKDVIKKLES